MLYQELLIHILRDMRYHKLRSILTLFGIVWGTIAVTLLLAIGQGFYAVSKKNMMGFVDGSLIVHPSVTSMPYAGLPVGRVISMKMSDVLQLKKSVPHIQYLSPTFMNSQTIQLGSQQITTEVTGAAPSYSFLTRRVAAPPGRFIDSLDIKQQRDVVFIGKHLRDKLFHNKNALGKTVTINGVPFTIIGVQKDISHSGQWYNNVAIIPYTTALKLWGNQDVTQIIVYPDKTLTVDQLQNKLIQYLSETFRFDPNDKAAVSFFNPGTIMEFFDWFFRAIEIFLVFCGVATLAVGGIGVANIMYLIVTERTAEIGLRMALGATTRDIMLQIILEACVIVFLGGMIGFIVAGSAILILQHAPLPQWLGTPQISFSIFLITFCVLALIGILAGYFPAKRAAQMKPTEALAF